MRSGLLLCDIGNTAIKIGLADAGAIIATYALPASLESTADSLGLNLLAALKHSGVAETEISACVTASVVPGLNAAMASAIARYIKCPSLFVPADLPVPLENHYARPEELGADRLVAAFAARQILPDVASLIVVDFGTAITFDCVTGNSYLGGLIFPGPVAAAEGLARHTARLPLASLDFTIAQPVPGTGTVSSIQNGLIFGFVCLVEGLCALLKKQLAEPVRVVATGGLAAKISSLTSVFDSVEPDLILLGLTLLYNHAPLTYGKP